MKAYIRSLLAEVSSTWMTRRLERRATISTPPEPEVPAHAIGGRLGQARSRPPIAR